MARRDTLHPACRPPLIFLVLRIQVAVDRLDRLQPEQLLQSVAHFFEQNVVGVLHVEVVRRRRLGRFLRGFGREFGSAVLPRSISSI